jgi:IS5 family transposase
MSSSKKGNQWYFGMKAHIGVDAQSGLVHTAGVTTGKVHDAKVMAKLIREDDTAVYGDKGYASDERKRAAEGARVLWAVKEKAKPGRELTKRQRARNRRFGRVRAKVEHVFRVVKCQFAYRKVRYRGIEKNGAQLSPSSRSPTFSSLAADLRPHEGKIGSSGPFQRRASGPSAAVPGKTPTSLNASERRPCCSEVP